MATNVEMLAPGAAAAPAPEKRRKGPQRLFTPELMGPALRDSVKKMNPRTLVSNPVMFVVEAGAAMTTIFLIRDMFTGGGNISFQVQISLWLWFTVLFANFAEAVAEGRGKAQANALRKARKDTLARRWRRHRGHRLGRRVRHHRRVRPGRARERR